MENKAVNNEELKNVELTDEALDEVAGGIVQRADLKPKAHTDVSGKKAGKNKTEKDTPPLDGKNLLDLGQSFRL